MTRWIAILCLALMLAGCSAGSSAVLLSYDNIIAAAQEAKKGVVAYDQAIQAGQAAKQAEIIAALKADVAAIAQKNLPPTDAQALADKVAASMTGHMANLNEQERRRRGLYEPTIDNLDYILQVCADGRQFEIYRSNVSAQWKAYLESTARARLGTIPTTNPGQ